MKTTTTITRITIGVAAAAALLFSSLTINAAAPAAEPAAPRELAIKLGAPFCDHAILQQGTVVPVWGWSKPGTKVSVEFAGQKNTATAGKDGKWVVELKDLKASFKPAELVINEKGGKKETLKNILVGEVWMASGQSNMQWKVGKSNCSKLIVEAKGNVAPIREFEVTSVVAMLHPIEKAKGAW
ncbi:MAG: hypothetical protein QGH94_06075, partial [Phycisphaerae bacterium]|nr:hypothetical protein [Phycisphaerae bacterium]